MNDLASSDTRELKTDVMSGRTLDLALDGPGSFIPATPTRVEDTTTVVPGSSEDGAQAPSKRTVDLMTIQRAYAVNADSLRALDSVLGTVVNQVGKAR